MIDSLTSLNHGDFSARYRGTYGFFLTEPGTKLLVNVTFVDRREARFTDIRGGEYSAYADSGLKFEFIPVNRGFFNTEQHSYFLNRIPARQWHRGICGNNTAILLLGHKWQTLSGSSDAFFAALQSIFVDPPPDIKEVFTQYMTDKRPSCALSKNFLLHNGDVYFLRQQVGTIDKAAKIKLESDLVVQEVKDAIKRADIPAEVI